MTSVMLIALMQSGRELLRVASQSSDSRALDLGTEFVRTIDQLIAGAGETVGMDQDVRRYRELLVEDLARVAKRAREEHDRLERVAERLRGGS